MNLLLDKTPDQPSKGGRLRELNCPGGAQDSIARETYTSDVMDQMRMTLDDVTSVNDRKSEKKALNRILLAEAIGMIETLPAVQKFVLIYVCIEGHTYAEAANRFGIPIGTVMSRIFQARSELRAKLL